MSQRSFAVLVVPERWAGSSEELADRLVSVTRQPSDRLARALGRGPVTLDADLHREEAERFFEQLERLEIPADIRDEEDDRVISSCGGSVVESTERAGAEREEQASPDGWDDLLGRKTETGSGRPDESEAAADGGRGLQMIEEADDQETPTLEDLFEESTDDGGTAGMELDEPTEPAGESGFDGARMTEALVETGESSNIDQSFDDRPEHIPFVAAMLSLLAPGAGQVYNGETDKAWSFAFRAVLVLPWIRAVIDALKRGEAIRDDERPRPPEGTFVEALKHAGIIYTAAVAFGIGGSLIVKVAYQQIYPDQPASAEMPAVDRQNAFREATLTVHGARIDAWQRAGEKRVSDEDRFTMSPRARAARLFAIGYRHCRASDYQMCESAMRKVTQIDSPYRKRAYRLQSWASVQQDPKVAARPMPDVKVSKGLLEGTPDAGATTDDEK